MEAHFRVLGFDVTLRGPDECLEPIAFAYREFLSDASAGAAWVEWNGRDVETDRGAYPGVPGVAPVAQLYPRFMDRLHDGLGDHAMVHAAVVCHGERTVLLAAPSGHGKSTLALELATRGWTLYSDDFAPLSLAAGTVCPYPRAVGIVPGSPATPAAFAVAAERSRHVLFGKRLVQAGDVTRCATADSPERTISDVFLIAGESLPRQRLELHCSAQEADRIAGRLAEIAPSEEVNRRPCGALEEIGLEIPPGARGSEALNALLLDRAVVFSNKTWSLRPEWQGDASCTPVVRREAAQWLARELLNRRPGGELLARHHGDTVALILELASALRSSRCWTMKSGTLARTADTIESVVASPRS